jgi:hypothetical protein
MRPTVPTPEIVSALAQGQTPRGFAFPPELAAFEKERENAAGEEEPQLRSHRAACGYLNDRLAALRIIFEQVLLLRKSVHPIPKSPIPGREIEIIEKSTVG